MSEKQVTVKSMMLDFAARLRGEGTDSVSLEFFERLANKEVAALEQRVEGLEKENVKLREQRDTYGQLGANLARSTSEALAAEEEAV